MLVIRLREYCVDYISFESKSAHKLPVLTKVKAKVRFDVVSRKVPVTKALIKSDPKNFGSYRIDVMPTASPFLMCEGQAILIRVTIVLTSLQIHT